MNLYVRMAHFVGKVLHIRPNEILDTWGCPELVVAFGEYANEIAQENYAIWKSGDRKTPMPDRYSVRFYSPEQLQDGE